MYKAFSGEYEFLCNFFAYPFEYEGRTYPTSEHAFQAAKTLKEHEKDGIAGAFTPGLAKKLGRRVQLRPDWNEIKNNVMYSILQAKFSDVFLKRKLLATGDMELVEKNSWGDVYWGVDINSGIGENHLGKLLMKLRKELKNEEVSEV